MMATWPPALDTGPRLRVGRQRPRRGFITGDPVSGDQRAPVATYQAAGGVRLGLRVYQPHAFALDLPLLNGRSRIAIDLLPAVRGGMAERLVELARYVRIYVALCNVTNCTPRPLIIDQRNLDVAEVITCGRFALACLAKVQVETDVSFRALYGVKLQYIVHRPFTRLGAIAA